MELTGISVLVTNQNIEGAIQALRRKCEFSRLKEDIQRHRFYLSRSERRKEKDRKAEIRLRKKRREYGS
jgi:ribosomal protein S21